MPLHFRSHCQRATLHTWIPAYAGMTNTYSPVSGWILAHVPPYHSEPSSLQYPPFCFGMKTIFVRYFVFL